MKRRWRTRALVAAGLVAALAVGACGQPGTRMPTLPTSAPSASASPVATGASASASISSPAVGQAVTVDDELLRLLPGEVAGVPLVADAATAAQIAADRTLDGSVAGVAVAAAFGPASSTGVSDFVVVTLARLEPGVFDDAFFRDWRDSFDEAVCDQAGGVARHAEAEIAGHRTYIDTCAGGIRTYHVHLPASDVIVSMQALGEGRYGERVVEGLTE